MSNWAQVLEAEQQQPYYQSMVERIAQERQQGVVIFPPAPEVFSALTLTPLETVKVVILGQDPYHGPGQAHGLCFSVKPGIKPPPSLVNIYKELSTDIDGFKIPQHGFLQDWATQGVLLLNTVLTVEQGKAHSHARYGWERFTDKVIDAVNQYCDGVVFLLWGSHAQKKGQHIDSERHHVLKAPHPSPLSAHRGFLGCKHFSKTNSILQSKGKTPINWQV
ncbi:uracil-DNA glycosylase [Alteromonas aestuariivivens]|uniref:Uracil-DNA glycosylase n=1 Tax=Alteromonas aestuariivivens TaxID=1938339 RepID=A0A3D8MEJ9_9ALTE|nr:uracil-DNA glycosylase [Alteromonas aestuariivivens]RDV29030.1 uracil-DNA glycosylase [Alteromonas aestuariivivens]